MYVVHVCVCVCGQQKGSWLWINKANEALKHLSLLLSLCGCCCVLIYTRIQTHTQTQMCSTLCRASHFFAATAFNWVEMCKKKKPRKKYHRKADRDRQRDRHRTCRRFRTSKRPLLLLLPPLHSLHLFTCWLCVYRKLAARILPLELSASPSLALALIGHCRLRCWRCLIASDSFKEPLKGLPILYTLPRSLYDSHTLFRI